jgi:hypothetical protein
MTILEQIEELKKSIFVHQAVLKILDSNDLEADGIVESIQAEKELLRRLFNQHDSGKEEVMMKKVAAEYFEDPPELTVFWSNDVLEAKVFYDDVSENDDVYFRCREKPAKA